MSFSDMMSSGRGPGVIGMVLALIVLLGFGLLFNLAFEEGFGGGEQTIESVIASQAKDIETYSAKIADGENKLATAPSRAASARQLSILKAEQEAGKDRIEKLRMSIEAMKASLEAHRQAFADYKDRYRAFVRGNAKGTTLETLSTVTGVTYKKVTIVGVSAVGIEIRHEDGHKRIAFEDLAEDLKEYYQFDATQKEQAMAEEAAKRDAHEAAADLANQAAEVQMAAQREKANANAKERLVSEIARKEATLSNLMAEIRSLQSEMSRAEAEASAARGSGKIHIDKSGNIGSNLRSKQNRAATLQAEIAQMKTRL